MTVSFLALTDTKEIRSTLGVDETDLEDSMIADRNPEEDLQSDLYDWIPDYATIIAEGSSASATTEQKIKYIKLRMYARYFISALVAVAGGNSILQKQSDGANEAIRFTNVKLTDLVDYLEKKSAEVKAELLTMLNPTSVSSYSQFGIASPDVDQVTG